MDVLLFITVIVSILYAYSRVVRKRLYRRLGEIYVYWQHQSLVYVSHRDAVGLLKLLSRREKAIRELMPWLRS